METYSGKMILILLVVAWLSATSTADFTTTWFEKKVSVHIGRNSGILYDPKYNIFAALNIKKHLMFTNNDKFLLMLNKKTLAYILIDTETKYAVTGTTNVNKIRTMLIKTHHINKTTTGSFNFKKITDAFCKHQFDLRVPLEGQNDLVNALNTSFGEWFKMVEDKVVSGVLDERECLWGFMAVLLDSDYQLCLAVLEVVMITVQHFAAPNAKILMEIIKLVYENAFSILIYIIKVADFIYQGFKAMMRSSVGWFINGMTAPLEITFTSLDVTYSLVISRVNGEYGFRVTINESGYNLKINVEQCIISFLNAETNIAITFQNNFFVLSNIESAYALLSRVEHFADTSGTYVQTELPKSVKEQRYSDVASEMEKLIGKYNHLEVFSYKTLCYAIKTNSTTAVEELIGPDQASDLLKYYGDFLVHTTDGTFGDLFIHIFTTRNSLIVRVLRFIINVIVSSPHIYLLLTQAFSSLTSFNLDILKKWAHQAQG